MSSTISLSDEDWDAIVKALLDHSQDQAERGCEAAARKLLLLTSRVVETLEHARDSSQ